MNKKVLLIVLVLVMVLTACGKGGDEAATEIGVEEIVENIEFEDFLEEYVAKLESNAERENFLYLWECVTGFCERAEYKLEKAEFKGKFEFDPTDKDNIPQEVQAVIDFMEFSMFSYIDEHGNYKMTIDGDKVTLSFDGHEFYPTDDGYLTVKGYVEKYNAE